MVLYTEHIKEPGRVLSSLILDHCTISSNNCLLGANKQRIDYYQPIRLGKWNIGLVIITYRVTFEKVTESSSCSAHHHFLWMHPPPPPPPPPISPRIWIRFFFFTKCFSSYDFMHTVKALPFTAVSCKRDLYVSIAFSTNFSLFIGLASTNLEDIFTDQYVT